MICENEYSRNIKRLHSTKLIQHLKLLDLRPMNFERQTYAERFPLKKSSVSLSHDVMRQYINVTPPSLIDLEALNLAQW